MFARFAAAALLLALFATANAATPSRGYLGVEFADLSPGETQVQGGVLVHRVLPGGAAERAGFKAGEVVTQIDGIFVADPKTAVEVVTEHHAGDRLAFTVIDRSNGGFNLRTLTATLAANPPSGFNALAHNSAPVATARSAAPQGNRLAQTGTTRGRSGVAPASLGTPVALQRVGAGYCQAMAPQGWQVTDINPQSTTMTVASPDGSAKAAYGIVGIGSGLAAGYYGPQARTPASYALSITGLLFGGQASTGSMKTLAYGFQLMAWRASNGASGYTMFRNYPLPSDPGGYIVSMYIGGGSSSRSVALAAMVASSIRCTAQLQPPPANDFQPSHGATCVGGECGENDEAKRDYNSILGTEDVHDAAGNNYYVGSENWIENGPDGPGYYKKNGNDVTKLQYGLE